MEGLGENHAAWSQPGERPKQYDLSHMQDVNKHFGGITNIQRKSQQRT